MKDAADQNAEALGCRPGAVDAEVPEVPLSVEKLDDCLVRGKVGKPKGSVWLATLMPSSGQGKAPRSIFASICKAIQTRHAARQAQAWLQLATATNSSERS